MSARTPQQRLVLCQRLLAKCQMRNVTPLVKSLETGVMDYLWSPIFEGYWRVGRIASTTEIVRFLRVMQEVLPKDDVDHYSDFFHPWRIVTKITAEEYKREKASEESGE